MSRVTTIKKKTLSLVRTTKSLQNNLKNFRTNLRDLKKVMKIGLMKYGL